MGPVKAEAACIVVDSTDAMSSSVSRECGIIGAQRMSRGRPPVTLNQQSLPQIEARLLQASIVAMDKHETYHGHFRRQSTSNSVEPKAENRQTGYGVNLCDATMPLS